MIEHNDFLAVFEMKKKIMLAQENFTNFVSKEYLRVNVQDKSDWRNQIKHC